VPLPAFGQQKTSSAEATYVSQEKKGPNNPGYCDFKEVDLGFMKFSIPANLRKQEKKCIEGGCWKFSD